MKNVNCKSIKLSLILTGMVTFLSFGCTKAHRTDQSPSPPPEAQIQDSVQNTPSGPAPTVSTQEAPKKSEKAGPQPQSATDITQAPPTFVKVPPPPPPQGVLPAIVPDPVVKHYEIQGVDDQGKSCSTGTQNFSSLEELCLNIQDPERNHHCAEQGRLDFFEKNCESTKIAYFGSIACKVQLYPFDPKKEVPSQLDPKDLLVEKQICAGYMQNGNLHGNFLQRLDLVENLYANISVSWSPLMVPGNMLPQYDPNNQLQIDIRRGSEWGSGTETEFKMESPYICGPKGGCGLQSGPLTDKSYRYVISCQATWACPAEEKTP